MGTKFNSFFPQALNMLKSKTLAAMSDAEIEEFLNDLVVKAVAEFRFPRISLNYSSIDNNGVIEYTFDEDLTQREINVLLAIMSKLWIQQQLQNEELFETLYYDRDVKTFSRGNMIKELRETYKEAKREADMAQYNYGRLADSTTEIGIARIYSDE